VSQRIILGSLLHVQWSLWVPNYYEGNWDGYMYCFDGATGTIEWRFFLGNTTETAMGNQVAWGRPQVADGKVYFAASQHTPPTRSRDHELFCVDAFTGELVWKIPFYREEAASQRHVMVGQLV